MSFAHLHVHTEYSLLDGSNKIKEYVKCVKGLGMSAAAITDHGVMYGVIDFYKAAKAEGIKPIIGCEVYVAPNSRFDKEASGGDERYYHLVLLAENNQGYANLMKIVSKGFTEGYYYKPRVDMEVLQQYHEGLIALSACLSGEVARWIRRGLNDEALAAAIKYRDCFGADNYFLEIQDHGLDEQKQVNIEIINIARKLNIPIVATNDVHYTYKDDEKPHDILLCIQTAKKLADEDRMRYTGGQYYVKSEEEMKNLFPYAKEAIDNTMKVAERCNVEIKFHEPKLPTYDVPAPYDADGYLESLCLKGLDERYPNVGEDEKKSLLVRLNYELGVIRSMGFVDYFLITWDFINYARENDISVGPGRGSAAGSIASYCLKITDIDPVKYDLLFERFLNPERVSMPDIDIDFCFERRQEVIDYVVQKYGVDKVVQIITFGTMAARGVIRDVGRVMDVPYARVDGIAKMIPRELNITIEKALEINQELRLLYESDTEVKELINMSKRLEGLPRHTSMHAAGVVICSREADEFVPLSKAADGSITTQFPMNTIEELGLLKMDFLGLRTLTVIQKAIKIINRDLGTSFDINKINYEDSNVFSLISSGKTEGVFQLESAGMKNFMKELKPSCLEDIIAGISLYRPGPMEFIPKYVRGKNGGGETTYLCKELEPILSATYGCIVYQEQVMRIVRDLGGYTLGRSDLVRRAMSKKKQDVMEREKANFVYGNTAEAVPGCASKGISETIAGQIYDEMMDFAKYAFNKSHAAAYAVIAYQTAYLRFYYPLAYMAALLTSVMDHSGKTTEYVIVCKSMKISVLPPDINEGDSGFSVSNGAIRYALTAIRGVGYAVSEAIVTERERGGKFLGLKNFIERGEGYINKRIVENLIKAGALDSFGGTRRQLMEVHTAMSDGILHERKKNIKGQMSLFDIVSDEEKEDFEMQYPDVGEYPKDILLAFEREAVGMYISGHPIDEYEKLWKKHVTAKAADFMQSDDNEGIALEDGKIVTIGGILMDKTIKYTKNNKIMAFITIEDMYGSVEVIVFPKDYEKFSSYLVPDAKLFIKGRVAAEEDKDGKLISETIIPFEEMPKVLWIKSETLQKYEDDEQAVLGVLKQSKGHDIVKIYIEEPKCMKEVKGVKVRADAEIIAMLAGIVGKDNVNVV